MTVTQRGLEWAAAAMSALPKAKYGPGMPPERFGAGGHGRDDTKRCDPWKRQNVAKYLVVATRMDSASRDRGDLLPLCRTSVASSPACPDTSIRSPSWRSNATERIQATDRSPRSRRAAADVLQRARCARHELCFLERCSGSERVSHSIAASTTQP